ncbi:protein phosphatase CheZ [Thiosulfatimonas sediminis]|uniref:Protein phosphatase CheZ n=1 Tax=Thiosulfatimonas sediminis TaxID=2675054 RepID=A0A6F8PUA6_9GAMM|nr:protein phosphatase CheZ [Thiosulfatimonas sediminis]BBP45560.1 protein phosphatase CheZ [Thiosulfatimonas sediminis]
MSQTNQASLAMQLELANQLVAALQANEQKLAQSLTLQLAQMTENSLYQQIKDLAENLHSTLDELEHMPLLMQTKHDIPDVTERLQYVLDAIEDASGKTLTSAENSMAIIEQLESLAPTQASMQGLLQELSGELNKIMLAQSFQDLTGQVLNRVILIISSLEQSLLSLIEKSGHDFNLIPERRESQAELHKGVGPNVTSSGQKDALGNQDDVDDLLADLGI